MVLEKSHPVDYSPSRERPSEGEFQVLVAVGWYRREASFENKLPVTSIKYSAVSSLPHITPNTFTLGCLKLFEAVWCLVSSRLFECQSELRAPHVASRRWPWTRTRPKFRVHLESEHALLSSKACRQQSASSILQFLMIFHEHLFRLLVPVGHGVSRAFSNTSCDTPYNLPNPHHLALFTFIARSHATNMRLCPDYPYGFVLLQRRSSMVSVFKSLWVRHCTRHLDHVSSLFRSEKDDFLVKVDKSKKSWGKNQVSHAEVLP